MVEAMQDFWFMANNDEGLLWTVRAVAALADPARNSPRRKLRARPVLSESAIRGKSHAARKNAWPNSDIAKGFAKPARLT